MPSPKDPTDPIRRKAAAFPDIAKGTSCTQSAFKTKRGAFLYIGPGTKGQGYKAMFKLGRSRTQAETLAAAEPDRFEVGNTSWVTARFTAERPLPRSIWEAWLSESYELTTGPGDGSAGPRPAKKARAKKA